ncbi:MAG TPA: pilus assembly protein [Blastocatellia bacterium]|nr:pilus assembly protein [Blastocatellia bacterium]
MNFRRRTNSNQRGATLVEMAIAGSVFLTVVFALLEFSRLLWTHNALADAARLGARYAAISTQNVSNVQNMVVYGVTEPAGDARPVVYGLTTNQVVVTYSGFGVKQGSVTVRVTGYQFNFIVPIIGTTMTLPDYKATLTGESAGYVPPAI